MLPVDARERTYLVNLLRCYITVSKGRLGSEALVAQVYDRAAYGRKSSKLKDDP